MNSFLKNTAVMVAFVVFCSCIPRASTNPQQQRKKNPKVEGQAGRVLPKYVISIDADYDSRLDGLIHGYKLVPVMIKNLSLRPLIMSAKKDWWMIVGEKGQKYKVVNTLRLKDPVAWRELPEKVQNLVDYPEIVPINYSVTFDLLIPEKAKLEYFKEIRYYNESLQQEFILEKDY